MRPKTIENLEIILHCSFDKIVVKRWNFYVLKQPKVTEFFIFYRLSLFFKFNFIYLIVNIKNKDLIENENSKSQNIFDNTFCGEILLEWWDFTFLNSINWNNPSFLYNLSLFIKFNFSYLIVNIYETNLWENYF